MIEKLRHLFTETLTQLFGENFSHIDSLVVPASNPKFGDYQCNIALSLAKTLQQSPRVIAQTIIDNLKIDDFCETLEIAGPGFINIKIKSDYIAQQIKLAYKSDNLGVTKIEESSKVIVDFSSPNIAKEMHVGHLRSTIIGDSIARILEFRGYDVLRLNHVGDWGTQFGMLISYLRLEKPEVLTTANAVEIGDLVTLYKQAKIKFDQDLEFQEKARQEVVKLQSKDPESIKAWQLLCEQSRREFEVIYQLLDITLTERGESFYNPFLSDVIIDLKKANILTEDQGAKCVFLEGFINKENKPLPLIVQKTDGGYNYATTDLAALKYRINEDKASRIIYVTDAGQANHFTQVFQVAKKANYIPDNVELVHVPFGLVLAEDGKKIKTRSGETIRLKDLLDEAINRAKKDLENRLETETRNETEEFINQVSKIVGLSAVKYADLSQNRTTDYKFSYEKMLALQGNTAPYLLYAYVRVQGISRKGNIDLNQLNSDTQIILTQDSELVLAKHLLQLDFIIKEVEKDLLPNRLCLYLFELSQKFNQFYDQCPILSAEEKVKLSRLILADLTAKVIKQGLSLLGISVLERM
ncbi:MAG: arginine--tRNA ligase [Cyanobacteria bacterium]|nr:arginine--tRNA ligase [Cyanobacteria bacterium CG_2015-16_32_12]NCO77191.1 arginine--tRNA ligase [Cyanobacteria bacterium CG_2015-22_32_23]NCQ05626.1 arginine--tRNA ligase [Cyanobacteria bacterium CG_2015-09_32_10]NCQ42136.1 arginine--tRNA ligase [Cyanobacteria bacterium CG_2015-04_32_10]NCS84790.1 arginine--tRNA ligase [Cyanobacteria bacterium CG_2015-02_32_10]